MAVAVGGALTPVRRARRFAAPAALRALSEPVRMPGRGQRDRTDIFKKRALIAARQPIDGIIERQPVDRLHVAHQFVDRTPRASMRQ